VLLKAIENLFKQQEERQADLQRGQAAAREELTRIRAELQAQQELTREYSAKADRLEQGLKDRSHELAATRDQVRQLEQQLAEARQEIEAARRRAEDYIHEATLARDNAVLSFQATLWDRLRACLVEVLDEDPHHAGLSPDQVFFRHRLQEIRDALRELGVPPY
jgi:chromosome segregation ATPase